MRVLVSALVALILAVSLASEERFDVLVRGGTLYDGSGGPPRRGDLGLRGDRIAAVGNLEKAEAALVVDVAGVGSLLPVGQSCHDTAPAATTSTDAKTTVAAGYDGRVFVIAADAVAPVGSTLGTVGCTKKR